MTTILFETARLLVRHIEHTDADAMYSVYGDADAMHWVGDGQPLDHNQCEHWIEVTHRNYAVRGYGMFALVERQSQKPVGFCGLVHPGGQTEVEIKYALCDGSGDGPAGIRRYGAGHRACDCHHRTGKHRVSTGTVQSRDAAWRIKAQRRWFIHAGFYLAFESEDALIAIRICNHS